MSGSSAERPQPTRPARAGKEAAQRLPLALDQARKKVLRERAKRLARPPNRQAETDQTLQVLEFVLAGEHYAVEAHFVREVRHLREFTALPGTAPYVLGIVHLRGQIFSVLDIKKFFDMPEAGLTDLNKVILLESREMAFGILADSIVGLRSLAADSLQRLPTLTGIRAQYLRGVAPDRTVVLDAESLLSDPAIRIQQQALT